jgi:hypothetical protein
MSEQAKNAAAMVASLSAEELLQALRTAPESTKRLIVEGLSEDDDGESDARAWAAEIDRRVHAVLSGEERSYTLTEARAFVLADE